jgi:hypothetical protein
METPLEELRLELSELRDRATSLDGAVKAIAAELAPYTRAMKTLTQEGISTHKTSAGMDGLCVAKWQRYDRSSVYRRMDNLRAIWGPVASREKDLRREKKAVLAAADRLSKVIAYREIKEARRKQKQGDLFF